MDGYEVIRQLQMQIRDIAKRLDALARLDRPPTTGVVTFSGTPVAGRLAQWTGAGTIEQTAYAGSVLPHYSGAPTAGAISYWTGNGTVAHASYGTADVARYSGTPTANDMAYWTAAGTVASAGFGTAAVVRTSDNQTINGSKTFGSRIIASGGMIQSAPTISDNAFTTVNFPGGSGILIISANQDNTAYAICVVRTGSGPYCVGAVLGSNVNVTTGTLNGTTGTDGKLTISAHSDGNVYIENRRGTPLIFWILTT